MINRIPTIKHDGKVKRSPTRPTLNSVASVGLNNGIRPNATTNRRYRTRYIPIRLVETVLLRQLGIVFQIEMMMNKRARAR
jgi:hypothetical protein